MKLEMGETDRRTLVAVMVVMVLLVSGAWFQLMYKPAKESVTLAEAGLTQAQTAHQAKQQELERVQNKGTDKSSVAKVAVGRTAIPEKPMVIEAWLQLENVASKTGVTISTQAHSDADGIGSRSLPATELSFTGHGTYLSYLMFLQEIEGLVRPRGSSVYVKGRLFNVRKAEFGTETSANQGADGGSSSAIMPKGHIAFSITLHVYSQQSSTPDGRAGTQQASTNGNAATGTAPGTSGTPAQPGTAAGAGASTATGAAPGTGTGTAPQNGASQPAGSAAPSSETVPAGTS